jgi:hypothetical protein
LWGQSPNFLQAGKKGGLSPILIYWKEFLKYNGNLMKEKFKEIESEFQQLKRKYRQKKISEREYKDRLKKLRLNDKKGRCWTIGARTGKWYYFDGKRWVESKPPSLQEGKAICIYCGYENDLKTEACEYCGGAMREERQAESQVKKEEKPAAAIPFESDEASVSASDIKRMDWERLEELDEKFEKEREDFSGLEDYNFSIRSFSPTSVFLFMGITGFIFGFILGVFTGATNFFLSAVKPLPAYLQSLQGKLIGGAVYGVLGGISGFILLGIVGVLTVLLINIILSFFGGVKIRLDRM